MIKVYTTDSGIIVREGMNALNIDVGDLTSNTSLPVKSYVEERSRLVYVYHRPLKVGSVYSQDQISSLASNYMVVMHESSGECNQYIASDESDGLWFSMGAAGGTKTLKPGVYKVLYLGE